MHFRWQNLDATFVDRKEVRRGWGWRKGRAWLDLSQEETAYGKRWGFEWEWLVWTHFLGLEFERDDEGVQLFFACKLFALWIGLSRWASYGGNRTIGWRYHNGAVWWLFWMDDNEWHSTDPKWRRGNFNFMDVLLGKRRYTRGPGAITEHEFQVSPEVEFYRCTVEMYDATWKRPRWFAKTLTMAELEMIGDLPQFGGKGENSWDLDDDYISSLTMTTKGMSSDVVFHYIGEIHRYREKYGMPRNLRYVKAIKAA